MDYEMEFKSLFEGDFMIKVSVIVPVYNTSKYLKRCLDSLVNQTLSDIEILVINDCSTDNSSGILDLYKKKYSHILRIFDNDINKGIGYTRNFGIDNAKGEYIAFIDSDDWVRCDMFEKMYCKAKSDNLDLVVCNYDKKLEKADGSIQDIKNDYVIPSYSNTNLAKTPEMLLTVNMGPCNKIYRRKLFNNDIRFSESLKYEDMIVVVKALVNADAIGFIEESLNYYLVRSKSETTVMDCRVFDIFKMTDLVIEELKGAKCYSEISEYVEVFIVRNIFRYTLQQKYQKDKRLCDKFINDAFSYLDSNFPNWRKNRLWKQRTFVKRFIESNKFLTKVYCHIF